jgi:hypothetical protein
VPETKQLTLEEMDIVFGSSGVAVADRERMTQINAEIGLDRHIAGLGRTGDDHVAEVQEKNVNEKEL